MNLKTMAHICSLNGDMDEVTILEKTGENEYIVDYRGVKCEVEDTLDFCQTTLAAFEQKSPVAQTKFIFNYCNFSYYVDDVYGVIKQ